MAATIDPLRAAENDWIELQSRHGQDLIVQFSGSREVSLGNVDEAYFNWYQSKPEPATINDALNGFGVLFGQLLADATELRFVIATDEHGSDLALFGYPGCGDVLVYPVNLVAKRWERGETGFFADLHGQMLKTIDRTAMSGKPEPDASSK